MNSLQPGIRPLLRANSHDQNFYLTYSSGTQIFLLCLPHGENVFVVSTKRFVNIASANQICWGDAISLVTVTTLIVVVTIHIVVVTIDIVTTTILDC